MTKPLTEGIKHDGNKAPFDLISVPFLEQIASVLAFGAKKYEAHNWRKGLKYSRVFSALMRHLWAFWRGETNDKETGLPHLAHAACCLMFLMHYESRRRKYITFDDRYKESR